MKLEFVNDLNESSQYRTKQMLQSQDSSNIAKHILLDLMTLWILYNEYDYASVASEYSKKTAQYGNFELYRQNSTDLYLAIYHISNSDNKSSYNLNKPNILNYMKNIMNDGLKASLAREFLQKIERDLKIDNASFRTIRRMVQNWGLLDNEQKSYVISRITGMYKSVAPRGELYYILKDFVNNKDLEIVDPETTNVDKNVNSVAKIVNLR